MTFKQFISVSFVSVGAFVGAALVYSKYQHHNPLALNIPFASSVFKATEPIEKDAARPVVDFEKAAANATPAVVHIKVLQKARSESDVPFAQNDAEDAGDGFEGMSYNNVDAGDEAQQVASGSGVAISADGYIITNNHVVEKADRLIVTLNDKNDYKAEVIGTDPSTDLAVIKIEGSGFPYLDFANSDDVHVGQWVLA
ncbi:MAG: trypsin-like peptidase domain-containing protein, partial [Segetibacter sp.]